MFLLSQKQDPSTYSSCPVASTSIFTSHPQSVSTHASCTSSLRTEIHTETQIVCVLCWSFQGKGISTFLVFTFSFDVILSAPLTGVLLIPTRPLEKHSCVCPFDWERWKPSARSRNTACIQVYWFKNTVSNYHLGLTARHLIICWIRQIKWCFF